MPRGSFDHGRQLQRFDATSSGGLPHRLGQMPCDGAVARETDHQSVLHGPRVVTLGESIQAIVTVPGTHIVLAVYRFALREDGVLGWKNPEPKSRLQLEVQIGLLLEL